MNSKDRQVYSVWILQFSCFTKYNSMQSKHKHTKCEHSRETLTDYSFLSIYHCTKSKNYLKRKYRIPHWIPMFIGTPFMLVGLSCFTEYNHMQWKHTHKFLTLATRLTRQVIQFSHKGRSTDSKTIEKDDL